MQTFRRVHLKDAVAIDSHRVTFTLFVASLVYRVVLVENIPEDISISHEGTMSLTAGLHGLLDLAQKSVEIVSPWWDLNSTEQDSRFPQAKQVRFCFI